MNPLGVNLDLDGAWSAEAMLRLGLSRCNALAWGPRVRCFAPASVAETFYREILKDLPPFVLSGSGDFHHLSALLLRKIDRPVTVISFDNHPDWDIRPPRWACGGWVTRALELSQVKSVSVWGCGNFELSWPHLLFANRRAIGAGRLTAHAWAERQPPSVRRRFDCMTRQDWRLRWERYTDSLAGTDVYVTVDLDALSADEAITNWEAGLFTAEDIAWAIRHLRERSTIVGGDICGAWSPPVYARWTQKFAAEWDRPKVGPIDSGSAGRTNLRAVEKIWPTLVATVP